MPAMRSPVCTHPTAASASRVPTVASRLSTGGDAKIPFILWLSILCSFAACERATLPSGLLQRLPYPADQIVRVRERLAQVVVGPRLQSALDVPLADMSAQDDHRHAAEARFLANTADHVHPAELRHDEIE